jgi:hypothetical protein
MARSKLRFALSASAPETSTQRAVGHGTPRENFVCKNVSSVCNKFHKGARSVIRA